jgi:hypothetical protein
MLLRKALVGCRAMSTAEGVIRCLSKAALPSDRQKCELRQGVSSLRTLDTFRKRQITTTSPFMHLRSSGMEAHKISKCVHTKSNQILRACTSNPLENCPPDPTPCACLCLRLRTGSYARPSALLKGFSRDMVHLENRQYQEHTEMAISSDSKALGYIPLRLSRPSMNTSSAPSCPIMIAKVLHSKSCGESS